LIHQGAEHRSSLQSGVIAGKPSVSGHTPAARPLTLEQKEQKHLQTSANELRLTKSRRLARFEGLRRAFRPPITRQSRAALF
jgi:hypothetical protein